MPTSKQPKDDIYQRVYGAPPPPFGTGRMSKEEREINDWLVKHNFNPLPMSSFDVGESPSEVARRLKSSSSQWKRAPRRLPIGGLCSRTLLRLFAPRGGNVASKSRRADD
jgi:hypothetical protein